MITPERTKQQPVKQPPKNKAVVPTIQKHQVDKTVIGNNKHIA